MGDVFDSRWLSEASRNTFSGSWMSAVSDQPKHRDSQRQRQIDGIFYSRKLLLTYHFVVLGFIALVTVSHWTEKALRWRRRRVRKTINRDDDVYVEDATTAPLGPDSEEVLDIPASPGSSTLQGTLSPRSMYKCAQESTPLLHDGRLSMPLFPRRTLVTTFKAFLIYQPRPIPVIHRVLPSNGTTLLVSGFIVLNVFYSLFHINFNVDGLFIFADRCGVVFVSNLPMLYLLAAKTQPLKFMTGHSYEALNILHRKLGELMCLVALLHSLSFFGFWYTILKPIGVTLYHFIMEPIVLLGMGAFMSYELLFFTSLAGFRRRWYELFLGFHVTFQIAGLAFLYFHHTKSRVYVSIAMSVFTIDRLVYRLGLKSVTVEAETTVLQDRETVLVSAILGLRQAELPNSVVERISIFWGLKGGWQATDHVFLTVPSLSRQHILQAHPFTIYSPAPSRTSGEVRMNLLIRAQDGFSADLLREATQKKNLTVRLDGPYGSSHARDLLEDASVTILLAGGSGIAVCWPLIHFLLEQGCSNDVEIASTKANRKQKIFLIWVIHRRAHLSWVKPEALQEIKDNGVEVIVPRATEDAGRPDLECFIEEIVMKHGDGKRIGVVGSGPDSMGRVVRNACSRLVRNGQDLGVIIEKFGW